MSIAKYPNYKATGLKWLEIIPSHWEVKRLKQFCNVFPSNVDKKTVEGETPVRLCNYTDVYYNDFVAENLEFMAATATAEQIVKFSLKAGDTIITKDSETADDIAIAAYVPYDLPGVICGYHLSMVRPKKAVNGAFVKRLFDSAYTKSLMAVRANGLTRVGLSQYAIDNIELPLPPKEEQTSIAGFLDRETAKIDALIAEQQRLIELLQDKRQAVISHAVTKGLNPNAPMKDSGVEWLGEVPEHWKVLPAGRVCGIFAPQRDKPELNEAGDGYPWITLENIKGGNISSPAYWVSIDSAIKSGVRPIGAGSVVASCIGNFGIAAVVREDSAINQQLQAYCPGPEIDGHFLQHAITSSKEYFESVCTTSTVPYVNKSGFWRLLIAIPPVDEQHQITLKISESLLEIEELCTFVLRAIGILRARRSALISAAITGQIDVRGLVEAEVGEQ